MKNINLAQYKVNKQTFAEITVNSAIINKRLEAVAQKLNDTNDVTALGITNDSLYAGAILTGTVTDFLKQQNRKTIGVRNIDGVKSDPSKTLLVTHLRLRQAASVTNDATMQAASWAVVSGTVANNAELTILVDGKKVVPAITTSQFQSQVAEDSLSGLIQLQFPFFIAQDTPIEIRLETGVAAAADTAVLVEMLGTAAFNR